MPNILSTVERWTEPNSHLTPWQVRLVVIVCETRSANIFHHCYTTAVLLALRVPANHERGPLYMEQALSTLHQANPHRHPVVFLFGQSGETVGLSCRVPDGLRGVLESQLYAAYPDCKIEPIPDTAFPAVHGHLCWLAELHLEPDLFPIKRHPQFDDPLNRHTADPLTAILAAVARSKGDRLQSRIEITVQPAGHRRRARAKKCVQRLTRPFCRAHPKLAHLYLFLALSPRAPVRLLGWFLGRLGRQSGSHATHDPLHTTTSRHHEREEHLQAASDKLSRLLFETRIRLQVSGPPEAAATAQQKLKEMAGSFGIFAAPGLGSFSVSRIRHGQNDAPRRRAASFLLSAEELATLWHPATVTVRAPTMTIVESRELEPPVSLPLAGQHPQLAVLGLATFRNRQQRFGILPDDRRRHFGILGKTGMGKTTLLENLIRSDIVAGRGVGVIDPHGDLCDAVLHAIPKARTNDIIVFDAGDTAHPLSFNVLSCRSPAERPLVASGSRGARGWNTAMPWPGPCRGARRCRTGPAALAALPRKR